MTGVLIRKGENTGTHTQMGPCEDEQRMEFCYHKPRNTRSHQKLEEARNRFSPKAFRGSVTLLNP